MTNVLFVCSANKLRGPTFAAICSERGRWGIVRMRFIRNYLLGSIVVVPQAASAQQQDVFRLFGGIIQSGIAAAIQADWERLPRFRSHLVDATLRQRGSSINDMVHQGVSPSDPRMAGFRSRCRRPDGQNDGTPLRLPQSQIRRRNHRLRRSRTRPASIG